MQFPYVKSNISRNLSNILCKPYVLTFTCHCPPTTLPTTPPWQLIRGQSNRQLIVGVSQRVNIKLGRSIPVSPAVLHPWQADPPLPSLVEIELSNHYTQRLPTSNRWHISQRNDARVLMPDPRNRVVGLDATHDKMLCALFNQSEAPTERLFTEGQSSCFLQQTADLKQHVPLVYHLLSCSCGRFFFLGFRV